MALDPNLALTAEYLGGINKPVPGQEGFLATVDETGRQLKYVAPSLIGGTNAEYADLTELKATGAPPNGTYVNIVAMPNGTPATLRYSTTSGNGFAGDDRTIIRLTANPTGNGVFYNTST